MAKSLLYRIFGLGKLSKQQKCLLEKEKCIICEEGIKTAVTYKDFKAPGKYFSKKTEWCITSIILTGKRLSVQRGNKNFLINVPFNNQRLKDIEIKISIKGHLIISFDAGLFHDDWSGKLKFTFKTEQALELQNKISEKIY